MVSSWVLLAVFMDMFSFFTVHTIFISDVVIIRLKFPRSTSKIVG